MTYRKPQLSAYSTTGSIDSLNNKLFSPTKAMSTCDLARPWNDRPSFLSRNFYFFRAPRRFA